MFVFSTRRRKQITGLVVVVIFQLLTWHSDVCKSAFQSQLLVPQTCVGHSTGMQEKKSRHSTYIYFCPIIGIQFY